MTEHEILTAVKNNGGSISYLELLEKGRTGQAHDTFTNEDLIQKLIQYEILTGSTGAYGQISFGKNGRLRLQEIEQIHKQTAEDAAKAAEEKRTQRRHDWAIAVFSTLGGALLSDPLWNFLYFLKDLIQQFFLQ